MALAVVGGGRRCGKSRYALALASAHGPRLGFIATCQPADEESVQKVQNARQERGSGFVTIEEFLDLTRAFSSHAELFDAIVVDDLTTWISNQVMAGRTDAEIEQHAAAFTEAALRGPAEAILVTSDVDFGFPMDGEPSRRFRRLAGLINRHMAESATRVYWMVFGTPKRIH